MIQINAPSSSARFGTLMGLTYCLILVISEGLGWHYFGPVSALTWIIPIPFLYRSLKNYREHSGEGFITFKKAFIEGLKTTFFSSLLFGMIFYLAGCFLYTGLLDEFKMYSELAAEEFSRMFPDIKITDEMLDQTDSMTLGRLAYAQASSAFYWGVFLSLLFALGMKRNPPAQVFPEP